ncbi:hypothetical protein CKM354_001205600 [Cercospora kikuchii]|uniref:Uncharacterized protein n=1 Tax=Cercospora kikuchii TaxID=84275 RepID=A0A9P3CZD5_9PEZI|nr:uncharacterized protein CKM354_001205600 [Cercospora kikuchii]GIZ49015.1 hypothetical protein CKM354_001205600 [Cercospora kikuchii]
MAYFLRHPFDYHACKEEELRKLIKDRTRKDADARTSKDELVVQLQGLDKEARFPFQMLPPELRIWVYENLVFHPNILLASSSTYKEAEPELAKQSLVTTICIDNILDPTSLHHRPAVSIDGSQWEALPTGALLFTPDTLKCMALPQEIASRAYVIVELKCGDSHERSLALYHLASILGGSSAEVCIRADYHTTASSSFWFLARLGQQTRLKLVGFSAAMRQNLQAEMTSSQSGTKLFECMRLLKELEHTVELAKRAGLSAFPIYGLLHSTRLLCARGNLIFTEQADEQLGTSLKRIQRDVDRSSYAQVKSRALAILAGKQAD